MLFLSAMKNSIYQFIYVVILITFSLSAYSTSFKWVVYFNDKPQVNFNPHTYFSEKAIERRIKHHLPLYTYSDLPVNENYVAEIASGVVDTKGVSRWLNCVFIYANYQQVESLKNLHYVARVEQLNSSAQLAKATVDKNLNENLTPEELRKKQLNRLGYDYFKGNKIDGSGVRVAIFDAGFPYVNAHSAFNHLFKNNRVIATYDFVKNKESVYGANSHGAQCLSNICGMIGDKPIGLATGIEVLLARTERVLTEALKEEENWLLAAEWADKNGADIISSSLGYTYHNHNKEDMNGKNSIVAQAARFATRKGMLVVNAAGNNGDDNWKIIGTPADVDSVLTVGGISPKNDYHIKFSSYGPNKQMQMKPNVCAYGHAAVAKDNDELGSNYGTSFATPLIAGFAACVMQMNPEYTNMEIFKAIERSAHLYPYFDYAHGFGVPQASYFTKEAKPVTATFDIADNGKELVVKVNKLPLKEGANNSNNYLYFHFTNAEGALKSYTVLEVNEKIVTSFLKSEIKGKYTTLRVHYNGYTLTKDLN